MFSNFTFSHLRNCSSHLCQLIIGTKVMFGFVSFLMKLGSNKKELVQKKFLSPDQENMDSSKSTSDKNKNVFIFSISSFVSFSAYCCM